MPPSSYILSFPRSGNHWVRFCIEYLSSRPTLGCVANKLDTPIYKNNFPDQEGVLSHVNADREAVFRKAHFIREVVNPEALLFIVRDYKECIPRYANNNFSEFGSLIEHYISLVDFFEKSSIRRLLIYYEDLIESPKTILAQIHEFIGSPNPRLLAQLIDNHDTLRIVSSTAQGRRWAGSVSNFKSVFHWDRLSLEGKRFFMEQWSKHISGRTLPILNRYSA